ncbi:sporulation and cell division regulator protein [Amycolatopsis orientalis]|uniref:Sporulation and cell division regulator protein n=1 Tax=Amycolatopsis orientalis TaxID=31958 RepID=A0A193BUV3_AMYOR|nr:sporulation and cell division regulator protein [Amycolatopsis orientalis]
MLAAGRLGHSRHSHRADFTVRSPGCAPVPVEANLNYDTKDPLVVTLCFRRGEVDRIIDWVVGRDLLAGGMTLLVGDGDVRIYPGEDDPGLVWLHLETPGGRAVLTGCRRQLTEFLDCTVELVPFGQETEWMEIDASIARFFSEGPDDLPKT